MPTSDSLSAATVALADSAPIDVSDGVAAPAIGRSMLAWTLAVSRSSDPTRVDAPSWDRLLTSRVVTPDRRLSDADPAGRVKGDPLTSKSALAVRVAKRARFCGVTGTPVSVVLSFVVRSRLPVAVHCHWRSRPPIVVPRCSVALSTSRCSTPSGPSPTSALVLLVSTLPLSVAATSAIGLAATVAFRVTRWVAGNSVR